ncbi:MAG: hypothetical protein JSV97_01140 [candidate division WOR-3 bacterium]|nr:MAG: hypothetical protein JSV97_01140 [candidate division WOR-3 bacterium]
MIAFKNYLQYKIIAVFLLLTISQSFAATPSLSQNIMTPYCCAPPFVTTLVSPSILISLDNSASMYERAYADTILYVEDTVNYYGYFKPDSNYRWESNRFVSDQFGLWPGRILNWACMSRADVAKKVLTGGKANIVASDKARLLSEGSGSWTKYY